MSFLKKMFLCNSVPIKTVLIATTAFLALSALPSTSLAQQDSGGWWVQRFGPQRGQRGPGGVDRMLERLTEELELDEGQREQLDNIMAERRERMGQMGQLFRQIQEARREGDDARVEELRGQLPQRTEGRWNPMGRLMEELTPILREDQLERLAEIRRQRTPEGRAERLANELELDEDQRPQFNEMTRSMGQRFRDMGRQWQQLRPLMEERRRAVEAGDDATADALSLEITEHRPDPRAIMGDYFDAVSGILREDQRERLDDIRGRMGGPQERLRQVAERLELDDDQRVGFDEAAKGLGERFRNMGEQWRELRPLFQQRREAQESGDLERARELSEQIEASRPNPSAIMDDFYNEVAEFLREDQIEQLDAIRAQRAEQQAQRGQAANAPPPLGVNPAGAGQPVLTSPSGDEVPIAQALDLDAQQRQAFDAVMADARKRRDAGGVDDAVLADQMAQELRAILREDQLQSFAKLPKEVFVGGLRAKGPSDVRLVFRAARQITGEKLNPEQARKLAELQKAAKEKIARLTESIKADRFKTLELLKRQGEDAPVDLDDVLKKFRTAGEEIYRTPKMLELGGQAKAQIIAMLTKVQAREFEQRLKRLEAEHRLKIAREQRARVPAK